MIYDFPGGSRAGGIIAACWATMISYGREGYVEATKQIVETTKYIFKEIAKGKNSYVEATKQTVETTKYIFKEIAKGLKVRIVMLKLPSRL